MNLVNSKIKVNIKAVLFLILSDRNDPAYSDTHERGNSVDSHDEAHTVCHSNCNCIIVP